MTKYQTSWHLFEEWQPKHISSNNFHKNKFNILNVLYLLIFTINIFFLFIFIFKYFIFIYIKKKKIEFEFKRDFDVPQMLSAAIKLDSVSTTTRPHYC